MRCKLSFFIFLLPLMFLQLFSLDAADFGLVTSQYAGIDNKKNKDANFEYEANILPRLSFLLGNSGDLFLSAGITLGMSADNQPSANKFYWIPELLRTEFSWRQNGMGIRLGRINYADPLGFIATGLFDGIQFSYYSTAGIFSAGAWYTGLLYRKNAYITMTETDQAAYGASVDYNDFNRFSDTYFASRRLLASLDWEHPSIAQLLNLKAAVTAQFDLTGNKEDTYHSQYITIKASVPVNSFTFELGGSLEIAEMDVAEVKDTNIAFAGDMGIYWMLPTGFDSLLALTGHFLGGNTAGIMGAFVPLSNRFYGDILKAKLSGLSLLGLNYTMRFTSALVTGLSVSHFIRNDLVTYKAYPVKNKDNGGRFLGTEFFARLVWGPFSDLQLSCGGGVFLPVMGNAAPDEKPQWSVELAVILALY